MGLALCSREGVSCMPSLRVNREAVVILPAVGKAVRREKAAEASVAGLKRRIERASEVGEEGARKRGRQLKVFPLLDGLTHMKVNLAISASITRAWVPC